jgi:hypothetical protein
MPISPNEAAKAKKLIEKIYTGSFDDNDVDSLFMKIRAFSTGYPVFREIADFVAHNECRNQGLTNESLNAAYLSFRYLAEYSLGGRKLDIAADIPLWVKHLMLHQIDKCDEGDLRTKFSISKESAKNKIKSRFQEDRKSHTCRYKKEVMDEDTFGLLRYILGFIKAVPAYTQAQILDELVRVLLKNNLLPEILVNEFLRQGNRIMVAVLCLLHQTQFDLRYKAHATCRIGCEGAQGYVPQFMAPNWGQLYLEGLVPSTHGEKRLTFAFAIVTTNLDAAEWTSECLYAHQGPALKLDFECDLGLDRNFKLTRLRGMDSERS